MTWWFIKCYDQSAHDLFIQNWWLTDQNFEMLIDLLIKIKRMTDPLYPVLLSSHIPWHLLILLLALIHLIPWHLLILFLGN